MRQVMPGAGDLRLEAADQLVLALRARIERLQPFADGVLEALVEAGLKVQSVELGQAAPVAAVKRPAADQAEGHRHRSPLLTRDHHADRLGHAFGQQAEEAAREIGRLPTHGIGRGVAGVDEVPASLVQFVPAMPTEVDALPRHLLTLLAHLLALARGERVEKILEVAVTPVAPMKLAAEPLQPAVTSSHQGIRRRVGEIEVQAGFAPLVQPCRHRLQQIADRGAVAEQPWPGDRREGHAAEQFGVVIDAGARAGVGPGPVEYVLTIGVLLEVERQGRTFAPLIVGQQAMGRLPARTRPDAAAVFEDAEKGMAQERLRIVDQRVPAMGVKVGETGEGQDRHARQCGPCDGRKKAPQGGA